MVKLKFVVINGKLVLRISEGKTRFYRSTVSLLTGNPNLTRYWNSVKEKFSSSTPNAKENNDALAEFKSKFQKILLNNPGLDAQSIANLSEKPLESGESVLSKTGPRPSGTLSAFMEKLVMREKAKRGCNFESYQNFSTRSHECDNAHIQNRMPMADVAEGISAVQRFLQISSGGFFVCMPNRFHVSLQNNAKCLKK